MIRVIIIVLALVGAAAIGVSVFQLFGPWVTLAVGGIAALAGAWWLAGEMPGGTQ